MRFHEVVDAVTAEEPPTRLTVDYIVGAGRRAQRRRRTAFASAGAAALAAVVAAGVFVLPPVGAQQTTTIAPAASSSSGAVSAQPTGQAASSPVSPSTSTGSPKAPVAGSTRPSDTAPNGGSGNTAVSPGVHTVLMHSYNAANHTAVIEPVTLGSGAEFCAAHHLTDTCGIGMTIAPSGKKYKLAVDTGVRVFSTQGGDPKCLQKAQDAFTIPGDCLAGGSDYLRKQVGLNPDGWLVQVANNTTFIYEVSEIHQS
jgi:hypothetical protein